MFNFADNTRDNLPAPDSKWGGFPTYNFVGGHNDADSLPLEEFADACDRVLRREGKNLSTYWLQNGPQGYLPLREFLVTKLKKYAGIDCSVDDILLTSGSLQAMDLINDALLAAGDTVIVEESNYGGAFSRLNRLGVKQVVVPVDEQGMQVDVLEQKLADLQAKSIKPRYIYTIPTVHNPTGSILSLARRKRLLELAAEYDVAVYEDECYADLVWSGERPPSLHALDTEGRVVHIGSFSKTIAPALRVGYVVADWTLLGQLLALKTDAGSGALEQMALAEYCSERFDQHVKTLNVNLKQKLDVLTEAIDLEFGTAATYRSPPGGIFLWLQLPDAVDTSQLAAIAASDGVAVNPGEEWSYAGDASTHIRLCFANPSPETIKEGVAELARICHEQFGVPQFRGNIERTR